MKLANALCRAVETAVAEDATDVYYYNFGLLSRRRLDWVHAANALGA